MDSGIGGSNRKTCRIEIRTHWVRLWNIPWSRSQKQRADTLSQLDTKGTAHSDIKDDILAMAVTTSLQSGRNILVDITPEKTVNETKELTPPTLYKILSEQSTDAYCDMNGPTVEILGLAFNFDKNRALVRLSPIEGAVQKDKQHLMRTVILRMAQYLTLARHAWKCPEFDTIKHE